MLLNDNFLLDELILFITEELGCGGGQAWAGLKQVTQLKGQLGWYINGMARSTYKLSKWDCKINLKNRLLKSISIRTLLKGLFNRLVGRLV